MSTAPSMRVARLEAAVALQVLATIRCVNDVQDSEVWIMDSGWGAGGGVLFPWLKPRGSEYLGFKLTLNPRTSGSLF